MGFIKPVRKCRPDALCRAGEPLFAHRSRVAGAGSGQICRCFRFQVSREPIFNSPSHWPGIQPAVPSLILQWLPWGLGLAAADLALGDLYRLGVILPEGMQSLQRERSRSLLLHSALAAQSESPSNPSSSRHLFVSLFSSDKLFLLRLLD